MASAPFHLSPSDHALPPLFDPLSWSIMMSMAATIGYGAVAALGGAVVWANLPTRLTIGAVVPTAKMSMAATIGYGAVAALGGAVVWANLPTRLTIGAVVPTANYLASAHLIKVEDENSIDKTKAIEASQLFNEGPTMVMAVRRPGCILCRREAGRLSDLKSLMDEKNIRLMAVVHESKGVNEFKPFFKGDVYFDEEKHFYGPNQRWLPIWMGALRPGTYWNYYQSRKAGFNGNTEGEGRLLGGVYLIDKDKLVWHHLERAWGDAADVDEVREAIKKFQ